MGTNYYTRENFCECCNRYDRVLHIGKSSGGWTFSFRGYRDEYVIELEDSITVLSFEDWKDILRDKTIINEYGDIISYPDFIKLVHNKRGEKFNHTIEARKHHPSHAGECWLDDEGNSFTKGEFS